jgi:hypothetical protein
MDSIPASPPSLFSFAEGDDGNIVEKAFLRKYLGIDFFPHYSETANFIKVL